MKFRHLVSESSLVKFLPLKLRVEANLESRIQANPREDSLIQSAREGSVCLETMKRAEEKGPRNDFMAARAGCGAVMREVDGFEIKAFTGGEGGGFTGPDR